MHLFHTKHFHAYAWHNAKTGKYAIQGRTRGFYRGKSYWRHYRIEVWTPGDGSKYQMKRHGATPRGVYSIDFSSWLSRESKATRASQIGYKVFFRIKWGLGSKGDLKERL